MPYLPQISLHIEELYLKNYFSIYSKLFVSLDYLINYSNVVFSRKIKSISLFNCNKVVLR